MGEQRDDSAELVHKETEGEERQVKEASKKEHQDDNHVGLYSDQHNIDVECEKLLRNTKKQVKQMMEEAVTKKFIHEGSSSIISLCVAVDACLSHGLKRRALGLFKTNSSTALIQKVAKSYTLAQEVLDLVSNDERDQQQQQVGRKLSSSIPQQDGSNNNKTSNSMVQRLSPVKLMASNSGVHKRNLWIKCALIEKKLVSILDHLAENSSKYYEPDALMANYLCAQILSSLLVGPSALEFSRCKSNDYYQFEDPSADELLMRHKLANPIACLCSKSQKQQQPPAHNQLSITDSCKCKNGCEHLTTIHNSLNITGSANDSIKNQISSNSPVDQMPPSPCQHHHYQQQVTSNRKESRRRPLALKTNVKRGTLVTDCHHYSCQEMSEHQQTKGYSFLCKPLNSLSVAPNGSQQAGPGGSSNSSSQSSGVCQTQDWSLWSPGMLHETLHQNSRSSLLYAKNNVLLETQPHETMAGYLSLHQTNSDLILKWIPNQMINGSQGNQQSVLSSDIKNDDGELELTSELTVSGNLTPGIGDLNATNNCKNEQPVVVESSYLDLVVSLSVSRIVLLHCQFGKQQKQQQQQQNRNLSDSDEINLAATETDILSEHDQHDATSAPAGANQPEVRNLTQHAARVTGTEETLILVEADGVQRAPFKFPKGGLRLFLSCLESGLQPNKYLDPAIKFDNDWPDPLESPPPVSGRATIAQPRSPLSSGSDNQLTPSSGEQTGSSRLDFSFLKRLPSLKRMKSPKFSESTDATSSTFNESPNIFPDVTLADNLPTNNYVYRIVSVQQPDWISLQTPAHSALGVASSLNGLILPTCSNNNQQSQSKQQQITAVSMQKFRWSLSKLARFSSRYKNSGSTTSSSSAVEGNSSSTIANGNSSNSLAHYSNNQQSISGDNNVDSTTTISETDNDNLMLDGMKDNSRELARIEAKLHDLKKSSSDDILALRTQSLQTLCESMRKQIVARAFYGWLVYCRKVRIIRGYLKQLIKENCSLIQESVDFDRFEAFKAGLTRHRWDNLMGQIDGRGMDDLNEDDLRREINQLVYYGGVESELRKEVWPYLLEHYKFRDTQEKRRVRDERVREVYETCGSDWIKIERVVKQRDKELLAANIAKVSSNDLKAKKSVINEANDGDDIKAGDSITGNNNNNDSEHKSDISETRQQLDSSQEPQTEDNEVDSDLDAGVDADPNVKQSFGKDEFDDMNTTIDEAKSLRMRKTNGVKLTTKRRRRVRLESTGSVDSDASITDRFGNNIHRIDKDVQRCDRNFWYFKEVKNLDKLRNIMCTYVWQNLDVGYVQGMCDLAAPFLVIFDDEILAFSCFSQLMKRMVANFPHGSAMDKHFESLKYLMQVLDPKVFEILQRNGDYTHFYFCYRWLLLDFKRELAYEDVFRVWETIWSARQVVTDHFVVFMALAMVRFYRDIIIENNMDFTDTIKFFNEMAERHDAKRIIALAQDCIVELQNLIGA